MKRLASGYENISLHNRNDQLLDLPLYYVSAKTAKEAEWAGWHEELEIKYIRSGQAEITCGPRVFLAEAGDLVVINSCELHSVRPYGGETPVYDLLILQPQAMYSSSFGALFEPLQNGSVRIDNLICADTRICAVMEQLANALAEKEIAYELSVVGLLSALFAMLFQKYTQTDAAMLTAEGRKYMDKLRPAVAHIQEHYRGEIKIETLAETCGLSTFHFCRLFKQITGYTVITYLNQYRIYKARLLLQTTDIPVAEIAEAVGYPDAAYFSRCFKKCVGYSPSHYRQIAK